jgi:mRNA interferase RelE/StbE
MASRKFAVEFNPKAAKEFKKLCRSVPVLIPRLTKAIDSLTLHPFLGKPLAGSKKGCYSLREGDYRIIYEIYIKQGIVHIIRIGHRRDIYR